MTIPTAAQLNQVYDTAAVDLDDALKLLEAVQECAIPTSNSTAFASGLMIGLKFAEKI